MSASLRRIYALLAILCLATAASAQTQSDTAVAASTRNDPAVWGCLLQLVDQHKVAADHRVHRGRWGTGDELIHDSFLGETFAQSVIRPDGPGKLLATTGGKITHHAEVLSDGSILWREPGRETDPKAIRSRVDGRDYVWELVTTETGSLQVIQEQARAYGADRATWGVLADVVGYFWAGRQGLSVVWATPGKEMIATWTEGNAVFATMTLRPGTRPGQLNGTISEGKYAGEYGAKVLKSGEVAIEQRKLMAAYRFTVAPVERGVVQLNTPRTFLGYEGELGYLAVDAWGAVPQRSDWGAYLDMVGGNFLVNQRGSRMLYTFKWLVYGKVLTESRQWIDEDTIASRQVRLMPNGKLMSIDPGQAYHHEAEGTVAANGNVEFRSLKMKSLGRRWAYERQSTGELAFLTDSLASTSPREPMAQLTDEAAQRLVADAQEAALRREHQARAASLARLDAFNTAMGAVNEALTATTVAYEESRVQATAQGQHPAEAQHAMVSPTQAEATDTAPQPEPTVATATKPLRFVLSIGLRPQVGDAHNPFCYSTIVSQPGPPGWGDPRTANFGEARKVIQPYEAAFLTKCRAHREIDGTLQYSVNQYDEDGVNNTAPRHKEDVLVTLN